MSNITNTLVDLWRFADPADGEAPADSLLQPDEIAYIATLRHGWQRRQWSYRRCQLRQILSHYVEIPPQEIVLMQEAGGKPYLTHGPQFSVSHSRGQTIVAVCDAQPVGIDMEYLNADMAPSVSDFLSDFVTGLTIPSPGLVTDILTNWTRVEAICKASGRGLAHESLDLHPGRLVDVITERPSNAAPIDWRVVTLPVGDDIICSVALEARPNASTAIDLHWRDPAQAASCAA